MDVGKAEVVCCVRVPGTGWEDARAQEVPTHSTMIGSLSELADRLVELGVTRVVMEATSDYWVCRELHQTGDGVRPALALAA